TSILGQNRIKSCRPMESAMRTTQQLSITLPNDMADVVKEKVRSGEYASESEVIRDGLRALLARDRAVENWLVQQVGPAYDALKADPSRALTADEMRARLAAEHAKSR
ncbi:ribbon-helix-helix domain-containing protein, partial [Methyloversatilis discipulorum]|uniref:ribbon-helix-helix domain-containing protein n=2 Tax=Methyloversatilis discipulorum TaxID=1119528 RepID=UPI003AF82134